MFFYTNPLINYILIAVTLLVFMPLLIPITKLWPLSNISLPLPFCLYHACLKKISKEHLDFLPLVLDILN